MILHSEERSIVSAAYKVWLVINEPNCVCFARSNKRNKEKETILIRLILKIIKRAFETELRALCNEILGILDN